MPKSVSKKRRRPHSKELDKKMRKVKTTRKKLISKVVQLTNKKHLESLESTEVFRKSMAEILVILVELIRILKAAKAEMIKHPVKRKAGQKTRKKVKK